MSAGKLIGVLMIVLGALALIYGGFSYTRSTHAAAVGPVQLTVQHRHNVAVPVWAGIIVLVLGGVVIALDARRS